MIKIPQLVRILHINHILMRHGLDELLWTIPWLQPLQFLAYLNPFFWCRDKSVTRAERIRCALEDLGPIFVKFGQLLSSSRDLLPDDIADELAQLRDNVPPFASEIAMTLVCKAYGKPLEEIFASFEKTPLASASVAQVHAAQLHDGRAVVVKILRPDVKKIIQHDLKLMHTVAYMLQRYWPEAKEFRPMEIVTEFEHHLLEELDLMNEAANASQLRRNFLHSPLLYVPEIYWQFATSQVIVMERIFGVPVADFATLKAANTNFKELAERSIELFFTQVFQHCFFHADMHAGNIFVNITDPEHPSYIVVDFGVMGTLNPSDQRYIAENLLAFFKRDYARVAQLHVESGWLPKDARLDEFATAIRTVCEPIFERPLKDISFGQLLLRLFQTARRFHVRIQPQLILLQKTLFHIEGLGREMYPELDLWKTAKPFLEKWMRNRMGVKAFIRQCQAQAPYWLEKLPQLPDALWNTLQQTAHTQQHHVRQELLLKHLQMELRQQGKRQRRWIGVGSLLLTAVITLQFYITYYN